MSSASLSARRAWIEIETRPSVSQTVESLSARRAWIEICCSGWLLASGPVALRKESVDRNMPRENLVNSVGLSLSARRAWIEIVNAADQEARKRSLSARRAWIEMCPGRIWSTALAVALRKESVDRNSIVSASSRVFTTSRSPQGERG